MSDLLTARLAKSGKRAARVSAAERDSIRATKAASIAALTRAKESRAMRHYTITVQRMQSLLTERAYVVEQIARERESGTGWVAKGHPTHDHLARIDAELNVVFATPCEASDFHPGGRFERSIAYHMRRIASKHTIGSMLMSGEDARDILSLALVRAYSEGDNLVEDSRGHRVPTLGSMFRLCRAELVRAVSRARSERRGPSIDGMVNPDVLSAHRGAASLYGSDPARIDWTDRDAVRSILTPAPRHSVPPLPEEIALAERVNRRRDAYARSEAERIRSERAADRQSAAESAAYGTDDTLGVDAAVVSLMASGQSLDSLADRLGVQSGTLARRLQSIRIRKAKGGLIAARIGSDGRAKRSQSEPRKVSSVVVATRKRANRAPRVIDYATLPDGWIHAESVAPVPHYSEDAIADIRTWTCDGCGATPETSEYATLRYHELNDHA